MKNTLKLSKHIPFAQPYTSKLTKKPQTVKIITRNLGSTFYPRLISIYNNLIEGMVLNNSNYIKNVATPELAEEIIRRRDHVRTLSIKMKANQPLVKLLPMKNYFMPQTTYRNDNFYLSVVCRVYFGGEFNCAHPVNRPKHQKILKFGRNRYLVWNTSKPFSQNLSNIFNRQIYEFIVKVESNIYLNLYNTSNVHVYQNQKVNVRYDEDQFQDVLTTEMVLRSSSEKFDWTLFDLNGILREQKRK